MNFRSDLDNDLPDHDSQSSSPRNQSEDLVGKPLYGRSLFNDIGGDSKAESNSASISRVEEEFKNVLDENFELLRGSNEQVDIEFLKPENLSRIRDEIANNSSQITNHSIFDFLKTLDTLQHALKVLDVPLNEKDQMEKALRELIVYGTKVTNEKVHDSLTLTQKYRSLFESVSRRITESANAEKKALIDKIKALESELGQKTHELKKTKDELKDAEKILAVRDSETKKLEERLKAVEAKSKSIEDEMVKFAAEKKHLDATLSDQKKKIDDLTKELTEKNEQLKRFSPDGRENAVRRYQELEEKYKKLLDKNETLNKENQELLKANQSQLKEVSSKLSDITSLKSGINQENQTLIRENAQLQTQLESLKEASNREKQKLTAESQKLSESNKKIETLQQEVAKLTKEAENAKEERKKADEKVKKLQGDLEAKLTEIGKLQSRVDEEKQKYDNVVLHKDEFNRNKKELETSRKRVEEVNQKYGELDKKLYDKERELASWKQRAEELERELDKAKQKQKELYSELEKVQKEHRAKLDSKADDERERILEAYKKEIITLTHKYQAEQQRIEALWKELEKEKAENGEVRRKIEEKNEELEQALRGLPPTKATSRARGTHGKSTEVSKPQIIALMVVVMLLTSAFWIFLSGQVVSKGNH